MFFLIITWEITPSHPSCDRTPLVQQKGSIGLPSRAPVLTFCMVCPGSAGQRVTTTQAELDLEEPCLQSRTCSSCHSDLPVLSCPLSILGPGYFHSFLCSLWRFVCNACSVWQLPCTLCVAVPMLHMEQAGNGLLAPTLCLGLPGRYRYGRVRGWSSAEGFSVTLTLL